MNTAGFAEQLHHRAFLFDGHNDLALAVLEGEDIRERRDHGHLDVPRMREGGFDGGVFAVWIDPGLPDPLERTLDGLRRLREFLDAAPEFHTILCARDLETARRERTIAAVLGVEGGYGIEGDLTSVDRMVEVGMRCLTLTWMHPTAWGDASGQPPVHGGLSPLGRRVVQRLQRLGAAVDVSHAADATVVDVLEQAEVPVIASHSGARAIADHHRNLPDGLLEGVAAADGVIGINFFSAYVDEEFGRGFEVLKARVGQTGWDPRRLDRLAVQELAPVPLERLLAHIEHAVAVAGPSHVGLGSDFDGVVALPEGLRDARDLPRISVSLVERGMPARTLENVLGANFLRCFRSILPS